LKPNQAATDTNQQPPGQIFVITDPTKVNLTSQREKVHDRSHTIYGFPKKVVQSRSTSKLAELNQSQNLSQSGNNAQRPQKSHRQPRQTKSIVGAPNSLQNQASFNHLSSPTRSSLQFTKRLIEDQRLSNAN
jgi:hypothetical protein